MMPYGRNPFGKIEWCKPEVGLKRTFDMVTIENFLKVERQGAFAVFPTVPGVRGKGSKDGRVKRLNLSKTAVLGVDGRALQARLSSIGGKPISVSVLLHLRHLPSPQSVQGNHQDGRHNLRPSRASIPVRGPSRP